jgi:hypothetical protein
MGYLGSSLSDYWPYQLIDEVIRQLEENKKEYKNNYFWLVEERIKMLVEIHEKMKCEKNKELFEEDLEIMNKKFLEKEKNDSKKSS